MNTSGARRFALGGCVVALAAAAALYPFVSRMGESSVAWALVAWGSMASIGVFGGAALVARHGRPGTSFMAALVAGMLTRVFVAGALALFAASAGGEAVPGFLAGLLTGFLPLMIFEVVFFARNANGSDHSNAGSTPDGDWLQARR